MYLPEEISWDISLVGLSLTVFVLISLVTAARKSASDWVLAGWLLLLNVPLIHSALTHFDIATATFYAYTNPTLHLLHGPLLYVYARLLMGAEQSIFKAIELLHLVPFVVFYGLFLGIPNAPHMPPQPDRTAAQPAFTSDHSVLSFLEPLLHHFGLFNAMFFIGYATVTIVHLRRHKQHITDVFSQNDNRLNLRWLYALPSIFMLLVVGNVMYETYFDANDFIHPRTLHMASFVCFISVLCFFGMKQKPVFKTRQRIEDAKECDEKKSALALEKNAADPDIESQEVGIQGAVDDEFISEMVKAMEQYMQQEKPFLDPDFSVYTLANALGLPRRTVSLVLNSGVSKNFYQYVNEFRINEVKAQLTHQDQRTVLDIAFEAGFKSKSSFNSLFKQHCGMTPSQFRKHARSTPSVPTNT